MSDEKPEVTEEETPKETCWMCAGTGKIRKYELGPSPYAAGTSFVPAYIDFSNVVVTYGT